MAQSSNKHQTKIHDSKSFIYSLQHFTQEKELGKIIQKSQRHNKKEIQYVTASTFDKWFAIRHIDVSNIAWHKLYDMKMSMPVVNSHIEFDSHFNPKGLLIAYFDGSIQYVPWEKINKYYEPQIQAGKKREDPAYFLQILNKTKRKAYVNQLNNEYEQPQEMFLLQIVCFLRKKEDAIYAINYKGQLKIFKLVEDKKIRLAQKYKFPYKVTKAQFIWTKSNKHDESIIVAICFQGVSVPYLFQLWPQISNQQIHECFLKLDGLYTQQNESESELKMNMKKKKQCIKLITYDCKRMEIIACTDQNQIRIFSFETQRNQNKQIMLVSNLERIFILIGSNKTKGNNMSLQRKQIEGESVTDLSTQNSKLLILCAKSFYHYDLYEGIVIKQDLLKDELHFGKMVNAQMEDGRALMLIKKKFDYLNRQVKGSTTLHLYTGKL